MYNPRARLWRRRFMNNVVVVVVVVVVAGDFDTHYILEMCIMALTDGLVGVAAIKCHCGTHFIWYHKCSRTQATTNTRRSFDKIIVGERANRKISILMLCNIISSHEEEAAHIHFSFIYIWTQLSTLPPKAYVNILSLLFSKYTYFVNDYLSDFSFYSSFLIPFRSRWLSFSPRLAIHSFLFLGHFWGKFLRIINIRVGITKEWILIIWNIKITMGNTLRAHSDGWWCFKRMIMRTSMRGILMEQRSVMSGWRDVDDD